ncbi:hypothetical protein K3495_g1937 [Podosphaera aphanis]|nr:hypothetical protein K3495_g1937 [Podosphaera aphanis]
MNQTRIADQLGVTRRQVRYTLSVPYLKPKKAPGRLPTLSSEDVDKTEDFITASPEGRQMSWLELASRPFPHLGLTEENVSNGQKSTKTRLIKTGGISSGLMRSGSPMADTKEIGLPERSIGEEVDINCVTEKLRKDLGWMFWGALQGQSKVPAFSGRKNGGLSRQIPTPRE